MRKFLRPLLLSPLALACLGAHAADEVPLTRLPDWAVPARYAIDLKVDPRQPRFEGTARIELELRQASDHVWLHGKELQVASATVVTADGRRIPARWSQADERVGVARVDFGSELPAQKLALEFRYTAPFNQQLEGLYKVGYQGDDYAITQMEPISARLAFPAFDEPAYKTPFELSLTVPEQDVARANTAEVATEPAGKGWKTVRFAPTLPLPTYLVAFGVGPWDVVEGPQIAPNRWRKEPVPLAGVAARGQGGRMQKALEQSPAMIEWLEEYFDYGYPFGKLDLVAAPDFSAGAMENPGFVTFRDWLLLLDDNSPTRNVKGSFNVTAHELAHQWTGDIVTMEWWDDLWLNEAYATWLQQKITMALRPEYEAQLDRVSSAQRTMTADSLVSARRIRQPITGNGDIETAFDGITYQKGAAVLAMFEAFVGEDVFRQAMRQYMRKHAFGNATAFDLIDEIAAASGKGEALKASFRSFIEQPGVPYLSGELVGKGREWRFRVQQQRYLPLGSAGDAAQQWGVPVCVRYGVKGGDRTACGLVSGRSGEIALPGASADSWVMPNAGATGYYRFSLPPQQLARLAAQVPKLADTEQLAYADALGAAFARGDADAHDVLEGMRRLAGAASPEVATALLPRFNWIWSNLASTDAQRQVLRQAASDAFLPRLRALGYARKPGESARDTELRPALVQLLGGQLEIPEVTAALLEQADKVLGGGSGALDFAAAEPDLLGEVLGAAVRTRGEPVVSRLIAELADNGDPVQRNAMLHALAATRDPAQVARVRDLALDPVVKVGEMYWLVGVGVDDPQLREGLWPWFTANFDRILARTGVFAATYMPGMAVAGQCSVEAAERLEAFFGPRLAELPGAERGMAQAAESQRLCAALKAAQDPARIR